MVPLMTYVTIIIVDIFFIVLPAKAVNKFREFFSRPFEKFVDMFECKRQCWRLGLHEGLRS